MSRSRIARISAGVTGLFGAIVLTVAALTGSAMASADGATQTPPAHGWIG